MSRVAHHFPATGLNRAWRAFAALAEPPKLDARDEQAMLAHVLRLAGLVRFFESGDVPSGTWADVLRREPLIILSALKEDAAAQPARPARIAALARDIPTHYPSAPVPQQAQQQAETVVSHLPETATAPPQADAAIQTLIDEEQAWQLGWIHNLESAGLSFPLPPYAPLPHPWKEESAAPLERAGLYEGTAVQLGLRRKALLEQAETALTALLERPEGRLQPHTGLLLTFLRQYCHVQEGVNSLVPLHADHFYRKVMGFTPKQAKADRALLLFQSEPGTVPFTLPAHTEVLCASEPPLVFRIEEDTPLNSASLSDVLALTPANPPGPWMRETPWENHTTPTGGGLWQPFPPASPEDPHKACSTLLSLPALHLAGGNRRIELRFTLTPDASAPDALAMLKEAWEEHSQTMNASALFQVEYSAQAGWMAPDNTELTLIFPQQSIPKAETAPFGQPAPLETEQPESPPAQTDQEEQAEDVAATEGLPQEQPEAAQPDQPASDFTTSEEMICPLPELRLSLTLTAEQPGLCAPQADTHNLDALHPALRLKPVPGVSRLWAVLHTFSLGNLHVAVQVKGTRGFSCFASSQVTPAAQGMPVEIFGPLPVPGAALMLDIPELGNKTVQAMRLHWNWAAPESFAAYFRAYDFAPLHLAPSCKKHALSDVWEITGNPVELHGGGIRTLECPLPQDGQLCSYRWSLGGTGSLFGHASYGTLLAQLTLIEASLFKRAWAWLRGNPRLHDLNPPFTPAWNDICLDYEADAHYDLRLEPGLLAHEHPWPQCTPSAAEPPHLFAHYTQHSLCLSFSQLENQRESLPLSLYFRLQNTAELGGGAIPHAMSVRGARLLHDATTGLCQSGTMRLLLDAANQEETTGESAAPGNTPARHVRLHWHTRPDAALQGIHAQAAWAVYSPCEQSDVQERPFPLPAGMLGELGRLGRENADQKKTALTITQPYASSGGRPSGLTRQGQTEFWQNCAEELAHRGQAVLPKDYERLVLRECPEVLAVRCLPHCDAALEDKSPGSVAVVIFAPQEGARTALPSEIVDTKKTLPGGFVLDPTLPGYADSELLRQIEEFLRERASPHVRLHVMQPHYERMNLRLRATRDPAKDPSEAVMETRQALFRTLSPWAFTPCETIIGRPLAGSDVLQALHGLSWLESIDELVVVSPAREKEFVLVAHGRENTEAVISTENPATLFHLADMDIHLKLFASPA
ncbi:hypothetical protein [Desulfovibrio cuneatus]|uniref:hypothetical protein n=1 Tax=Desulfovibrio cuneatus TaxID=159728 RepID=UPI0003F87AFD|nr:hypothetical protein [Desulfovibrio cuneatus]